jgi:hypothetical protein
MFGEMFGLGALMLDTQGPVVTQFSTNMIMVHTYDSRGSVRLALVVFLAILACLGAILCCRLLMSGAMADQPARYVPAADGVFKDEATFRSAVALLSDIVLGGSMSRVFGTMALANDHFDSSRSVSRKMTLSSSPV